jgi:hypothetical protein
MGDRDVAHKGFGALRQVENGFQVDDFGGDGFFCGVFFPQ